MSAIGFKFIKYAKYSDTGGTVSYSGGRAMGKSISADLTLDVAEAELYTGDVLDESVKEITGGNLAVGVKAIDYQAREDLYGNKRTEASEEVPESVRTNVNDQSNPVGIGLCAPVMRSGIKKFRAVFLDKVVFSPPGLSLKTKEKTIAFTTPTTAGKIMPNINGDIIDDATFDTAADAEAWIDTHLNIT